jgi:hypothetical protein
MSLTKLSLAGNTLVIPGQGEFGSDSPAGDGKNDNIFYSVPFLGTAEFSASRILIRARRIPNIGCTPSTGQETLYSKSLKFFSLVIFTAFPPWPLQHFDIVKLMPLLKKLL